MKQPDVRTALAALATLPDDHLMGWWKAPDGSAGADLTVADLRKSLLDGTCTVDVEHIPDSVRLMHALRHALVPSEDELLARLHRYQERWSQS